METDFGPYRLGRVLGRGGMGQVYLAYDTGHRREVAIKLLLESLSADPEYRARFEREAHIAAGLREQHIIPIHRYGEIDNRLFIDMRLVDGEDLGKVLTREGVLAPQRAVRIIGQVASALDAAHSSGLVHRDVKPANILLAATGGHGDSVYLADFGIARHVSSSTSAQFTQSGAAIGTPDYMAPERFTADSAGPPSDIYSLGCLLHEMLTGRKPFTGSEPLGVLFKHVNEPPPRPSAFRPELPPALDLVVARAMDKDPARRHRTAGEFAAAAEAALQVPVPPARAARPTRRWPDWFYGTDPASGPAGVVKPGRSWPTATDYVRAVQAVPDPLAAAGLPGARLVRDPLGMPASSSGQNAVVFEMDHQSGPLALRCFTRFPDDAAARYRALAQTLDRSGCDAVVPARWVGSAVRDGDQVWPAVVMPWVSGLPLNLVVEQRLGNPDDLSQLAATWMTTVASLVRSRLAHGDLQCGNVLVDGTGEMFLVDLDGFHLPSIGRAPAELGHPDFQHPGRSAAHWGPEMDGFSILVILLSLRALARDPALWQFNSAENLILSRTDFERPGATAVWARLRGSGDPEVVRLTEVLLELCRAPAPPRTTDVLARIGPAAPAGDTPLPSWLSDSAPQRAAAPPAPAEEDPDVWWDTQTAVQLVRPSSPPPRTSAGNQLTRNAWLTGLTSGLVCAVLVVLLQATLGALLPPVAAAPLLVVSAGALLTAALSAVPRATMGAWSDARRLALRGAGLGGALAFLGLLLYTALTFATTIDGPTDGRIVLAWVLVAVAIGVAAGVMRGSRRVVVNGIVGGLLGGLVGGLVHQASGPVFVGPDELVFLEIDVLQPLTAFAIGTACAAMGLAIGLVDRLRRRTWLTVIEGGLRGREVILDRNEAHIGAAGSATLRFAGDPAVIADHAVLTERAGLWTVRCHAPVEINGLLAPPAVAVPLSSGDVLRFGGSFVRFELRTGA